MRNRKPHEARRLRSQTTGILHPCGVFVATAAVWCLAACGASAQPARAYIEAADAILTIAEEVEVSAAAAGRLQVLTVREGSLVTKGDRLLGVDDRRARLAEGQALIEVKRAANQAKSDVSKRHAAKASELAESEYQRALAIDAESPSSVSDRELNRLRLAAEVAELEVEKAVEQQQLARFESQLKQDAHRLAQQETADHLVDAPIAGLVVEVHRRPGEWVERGDPVVTLVRVDRMRAEGFVPVAQATFDLTGQPAAFQTTLADGERLVARGKVVFVSPKADPVSALARVWVEFPAKDRRLRPGLRGSIRIQTPRGPSAVGERTQNGERTDGPASR